MSDNPWPRSRLRTAGRKRAAKGWAAQERWVLGTAPRQGEHSTVGKRRPMTDDELPAGVRRNRSGELGDVRRARTATQKVGGQGCAQPPKFKGEVPRMGIRGQGPYHRKLAFSNE